MINEQQKMETKLTTYLQITTDLENVFAKFDALYIEKQMLITLKNIMPLKCFGKITLAYKRYLLPISL